MPLTCMNWYAIQPVEITKSCPSLCIIRSVTVSEGSLSMPLVSSSRVSFPRWLWTFRLHFEYAKLSSLDTWIRASLQLSSGGLWSQCWMKFQVEIRRVFLKVGLPWMDCGVDSMGAKRLVLLLKCQVAFLTLMMVSSRTMPKLYP